MKILQSTVRKLWRDVWMYICLLFLVSMLGHPTALSIAAVVVTAMACICRLFTPLASEYSQQ